MRKTAIFILVLSSLFSCNEKINEFKISKELIDLICEETLKEKESFDSKKKFYINHYNDIEVFAKLNNGKFIKTRFYEFLELYEKKFKSDFDSFDEFMNEVINENFVLNENDFIKTATFHLDKHLKKEFKSLSFDVFLKKYSLRKKDDKNLYLKDENFSGNRYLTISYLLYTKGYYLGGGCLGEGTGIYEFERLLNK